MLTVNKEELSRMNNLRADAREKIIRLKEELIQAEAKEGEATTWINTHMQVVYPTGGIVSLPKEGGRGAIVIIRKEHAGHKGVYITEIHNAD